MSEEKILTCYEWFEKELKKDCKIPNGLPKGRLGDPSILEPLLYIVDLAELYAEYYYEMKMKEILQKQEEEKILRDYLNQCYVRNQKT